MKTALIIGSNDFFAKDLVEKLYMERWRIYTLVSNKRFIKPSHVFEQYVFDYKSDSIKDIIKSCRPNLIIFTGAYDSLYNWDSENVKNVVLDYTADLINVLISATMQGVGHFIYISSETVFEDEYIIDITEDTPVSPNSYKGIAISQGENMSAHFGTINDMEVTIVRLANMYGIPSNRKENMDICGEMCVKALVDGTVHVNAKSIFSPLFVKDAVETIFILMNAPKRNYNLYHVSSMEEVTENDIAELIKVKVLHPVDIIDETEGVTKRRILSNERFVNEFNYEFSNSYKDIIPRIISYMNNHKRKFLNSNATKEGTDNKSHLLRLFKKLIPFLEAMALFIPVFLLSNGSIKIWYVEDVNFYLLYVLLFALVYGRQLSVFASLLSLVGYNISYMMNASTTSYAIDTRLYIQIVQIFIVGLSVGHLKDKFIEANESMNNELSFLKEQLNDIMAINSSNERIKDYYTDKVISNTEGIGTIYNITSKLQDSEKGEVLFASLDTLKKIMDTEDVSIYLVSNSEYCRLASASSQRAISLGKSISMKKNHIIFDVLQSDQVFINRTLDNSLPMMASALFDDERNMRIVIFLWDLSYEKMTLYYSNLLTVVGALVYSMFMRDVNYLDVLAYKRHVENTSILHEDAFLEMTEVYKRAGEKGYAVSSVLFVKKGDLSINEINDKINPLLRDTDYIGMQRDGEIAILLTNSDKNESEIVKERLEKNNIITSFGYVL